MSKAQEKLARPTDVGQGEKDVKKRKLTFTPPVLREYGEVVKICRGGHENVDPSDIYYSQAS